jgi:hypothetical protein
MPRRQIADREVDLSTWFRETGNRCYQQAAEKPTFQPDRSDFGVSKTTACARPIAQRPFVGPCICPANLCREFFSSLLAVIGPRSLQLPLTP